MGVGGLPRDRRGVAGRADHARGPEAATRWSKRTMAAQLRVSAANVSRYLWIDGLKPHGPQVSPFERALVLCCDENVQVQALDDRSCDSAPTACRGAMTMPKPPDHGTDMIKGNHGKKVATEATNVPKPVVPSAPAGTDERLRRIAADPYPCARRPDRHRQPDLDANHRLHAVGTADHRHLEGTRLRRAQGGRPRRHRAAFTRSKVRTPEAHMSFARPRASSRSGISVRRPSAGGRQLAMSMERWA